MDVTVWDKDFNRQSWIDNYESLLWSVRYSRMGEFKLTMGMDQDVRTLTKLYPYLSINKDDHLMVVEEQAITVDSNGEARLTLSGRSLESLLTRRIIWDRISHNGKLIDLLTRVMNESFLNPKNAARKVSNLTFWNSAAPDKVSMTVDKQYTGDNVYSVFEELCTFFGLGFKVELLAGKPRVTLYNGVDYSYTNTNVPFVVISPQFDNLSSSQTEWSNKEYKTIALVGGEGEDTARRYAFTGGANTGSETGFDRRELFVDARDLQSKVNDVQLSAAQYNALLGARGKSALKELEPVTKVDGIIDPVGLYAVNDYWFLGDIVQVENGFGDGYRARVDELVYTQDREGYRVSPTFKNIDIPSS